MGQVAEGAFRRTRRRAGRTNTQVDQAAFEEHARQVGEIVYLWNRLHGELFMIFWSITDRKDYEFALSIWHSIQSDSTQRQMIEGAAKARLKPRMRGHVLWLCRCHERLAPYRNAFAHVGFYYLWEVRDFVPNDLGAREAAIKRLAEYPKPNLFKKLRGDLRALVEYAEDIHLRLFYDIGPGQSASPWNERPRLHLAALTPPKPSKLRSRKKAQGSDGPA
jgi:hypothetical protein